MPIGAASPRKLSFCSQVCRGLTSLLAISEFLSLVPEVSGSLDPAQFNPTTFDDSSDNDDDGQGIEDFVFTVELWTEEKKSPWREWSPFGARYKQLLSKI